MRIYRLHTSPRDIRRPVRSSALVRPLNRVVGWTAVALVTLVVPVSEYAWHDTNHHSAGNINTAASTNTPLGTSTTNSSSHALSAINQPPVEGGAAVNQQVNTSVGSNGTGDDNQQTTGHVSASSSGNASSSVTINGETLNVPADGTVHKTVTSNSNNASLNVTMHSNMNQTSAGSSSVSVQVDSSSTTGGGQQ